MTTVAALNADAERESIHWSINNWFHVVASCLRQRKKTEGSMLTAYSSSIRAVIATFVMGLAFALAAVGPAAAQSNCNSGNVANGNLLSSAACQGAATGSNDTAIGANAQASGSFSVATGSGANATGLASTAVGAFSTANKDFASALGELANASGNLATALGSNSFASGEQATATGVLASASGAQSAAIGASSTASGAGSTALGNSAAATGANSTAVGQGANANFANSAAFGQAAIATRADQQVFGTATNSYTLAGLNAASTAAQVGATQLVTADSTGTLGVASLASLGLASGADITKIQGQIDDLFNRDRKLTQGIAMAAAIPHAIVLPGEKFSFNIDWANFNGANAVGLASALRLGTLNLAGNTVSVQGHAGVSLGVDGGGNQAVTKAGVRLGW